LYLIQKGKSGSPVSDGLYEKLEWSAEVWLSELFQWKSPGLNAKRKTLLKFVTNLAKLASSYDHEFDLGG
jgi:hypothetical protein